MIFSILVIFNFSEISIDNPSQNLKYLIPKFVLWAKTSYSSGDISQSMEDMEKKLSEETNYEPSLSEAVNSFVPRFIMYTFMGFFAMKSVQNWAYRGF